MGRRALSCGCAPCQARGKCVHLSALVKGHSISTSHCLTGVKKGDHEEIVTVVMMTETTIAGVTTTPGAGGVETVAGEAMTGVAMTEVVMTGRWG